MANNNGISPPILPETRELKRSVQDDQDGRHMSFIMPFLDRRGGVLPPSLPPYKDYGYFSARDILLLSTVNKEDQWGNAVAMAAAKVASRGWEVDSEIPIRRKRAQDMLKEAGAGMGLFGMVPFLTVHLTSYLLTGNAFIEIEREGPAKGFRVINIHHLNPLRCRLTGDSRHPVNYLSEDGTVKKLAWYQVIVISDMLTVGTYGIGYPMGAAERAYNTIRKMANLENFLDEKISGRRPLSINFVGGITKRAVNDMLTSAQHEADTKSLRSYMGAAIVAVPGDTPVSNITIPIAELPDITDVERERNQRDLIYANAIGLDPQDINPQIVGRQGLGSTGNQSEILKEKDSGRGLSKWSKDFVSQLNLLVLDTSTTFTFIENDLSDRKQKADIEKTITDTNKTRIDAGIITAVEARNLEVDAGSLPPEFVEKDITGADKLRDNEKPDTPEEVAVRASRPKPDPEPEPKEGDKKPPEVKKEWSGVYH